MPITAFRLNIYVAGMRYAAIDWELLEEVEDEIAA
jgi:hypothetical protein